MVLNSKYACILLFQFVFTKYVFGFRNYDGFIFVVIVVIFEIVIRRNYDQIRISRYMVVNMVLWVEIC